MNYQEIKEIIKNKLSIDYEEVVLEIEECISRGSTGGEITAMVGYYLKNLSKKNSSAYELIKYEIDLYLKNCEDMGLIII
jgi:hypothetical protein